MSVEKLQAWLDGKFVDAKEFKDSLQIVLAHLAYQEERLSQAESLLSDASSLLSDVHCYDTNTYREISAYLYGEEE